MFEMVLSENKERPLIENFRGKIQSKMGCAPHQSVSQTASPRGEAYEMGNQ